MENWMPIAGLVGASAGAALGLAAAARSIPAALAARASWRSPIGETPDGPGTTDTRLASRRSSIAGLWDDALRHTDGSYTAAWRAEVPASLLGHDDRLDARVEKLAGLLSSIRTPGVVVQMRLSTHPDPGLAVRRHLETRAPDRLVHGPSRRLHDLGVDHLLSLCDAGAVRHSVLSIWVRVPPVASGSSQAGAAIRAASLELRRAPFRIGRALGAAREAAADPVTRRLMREEREAFDHAARVFRHVEQGMPVTLRRLTRDELWRAVYLGANLEARSVPALPRAGAGFPLADYLAGESISRAGSWVMHGNRPVALVSLVVPPHDDVDASALRGIISDGTLAFRHTLATEFITVDQTRARKKLDRRAKVLDWTANMARGGRRYTPEARQARTEIAEVRQELANSGHAIVRARMWAVVYGDPARTRDELSASLATLDERVEAIIDRIRDIEGADAVREQSAALSTLYEGTIPGEIRLTPTGREIEEESRSVACLATLESEWSGSPAPHTLTRTRTGRLVGIDLYDAHLTTSPVVICLGQMGSGKSVLMGRIINDVLATLPHARAKAVDFGESFGPLADVVGGRQLRFDERDIRPLNVWDYPGLDAGEPPEHQQITLVADELLRLARVPDNDGLAEAIVTTIVKLVYENEVPYNFVSPDKHEPRLSHFLNAIASYPWDQASVAERAATLATQLGVYRDDPWLDAATHADYTAPSPLDVFEIDSLANFPTDIRAALAFRVGARVARAVGERAADGTRTPVVVAIDEMWKCKEEKGYQPLLAALKRGVRMGRKEKALTLLATHDYADLSDMPDIAANAGVRIIGQTARVVSELARDASLSPAAVGAIHAIANSPGRHAGYLAAFGSGEGLVSVGLHVELSPVELWTYTTHPDERNARARLGALRPDFSTADIVSWLAERHPRGLVSAGLRGIDERDVPALEIPIASEART